MTTKLTFEVHPFYLEIVCNELIEENIMQNVDAFFAKQLVWDKLNAILWKFGYTWFDDYLEKGNIISESAKGICMLVYPEMY